MWLFKRKQREVIIPAPYKLEPEPRPAYLDCGKCLWASNEACRRCKAGN